MIKDIKKSQIIEKIKEVYDPEIPVDVYSLGLIYDIKISEIEDNNKKDIYVLMTLTSPNCPAAETIPKEIQEKIEEIDLANSVTIEITFDPPYDPSMMNEEAKLELGF